MTLDPGAIQAAYGGAAAAWAEGPAEIYRAMARPLVDRCPVMLRGATVLDVGAGSGATTDVLRRAGATIVAADLSPEMLAVDRGARPPAVAADMYALPFVSDAFDVAVGAFVLSHLPEPAVGLAEVARTVRPGGAVLTVGFSVGWEYPAKATVEEVARRHGFARPAWYDIFKRDVEGLTGTTDQLTAVAVAAGLENVQVSELAVDTGVADTDRVIAWRLGTPIFARFVARLAPAQRDRLVDDLRAALGDAPAPVVPELLVLVARVP